MQARATSSTSSIRVAQPTELRAIENLLVAAHLRADGIAPYLADFFVADDAGSVVGAVGLEHYGEYGMLRSLVVQRTRRGHGFGSALTARLLEAADARNLQAIYLLATTAVTFFPRFGFADIERDEVPVAVQRSRDFLDTSPASAVVMRRRLER